MLHVAGNHVTYLETLPPAGRVQSCSQASKRNSISIRDLACLISKLTATAMAVLPAPLCYRKLQQLKNQTQPPVLTPLLLHHNSEGKRPSLLSGLEMGVVSFDVPLWEFMFPQLQLLLWGLVKKNFGLVVARGSKELWSEEVHQNHINHLELLGTALAV